MAHGPDDTRWLRQGGGDLILTADAGALRGVFVARPHRVGMTALFAREVLGMLTRHLCPPTGSRLGGDNRAVTRGHENRLDISRHILDWPRCFRPPTVPQAAPAAFVTSR
jgi:hypothetical protein